MYITATLNHDLHTPTKELYNWVPSAIASTKEKIDTIEQAFHKKWQWISIEKKHYDVDESTITAVHTEEYIAYLKSRETCLDQWEESFLNDHPYIPLEKEPINETAKKWYYCSDTYTPFTKHIRSVTKETYNAVHAAWIHALQSWGYAYALTRPPGHHAMPWKASGYCYLAYWSIFAHHLTTLWKKVAILDIDYHHGNWAQHIFYDRNDVITASIHRNPADKFPYYTWFEDEKGIWEGLWSNMNTTLWSWVTTEEYLIHLEKTITFIESQSVDFLVVSLWFDTLETDPICDLWITIEWFRKIGDRIKEIHLPTLFIQEWWYDTENVGRCAVEFFDGYM